jgi:hypothetical protein
LGDAADHALELIESAGSGTRACLGVTAKSDATLLAFLINRRAILMHAGTIGG